MPTGALHRRSPCSATHLRCVSLLVVRRDSVLSDGAGRGSPVAASVVLRARRGGRELLEALPDGRCRRSKRLRQRRAQNRSSGELHFRILRLGLRLLQLPDDVLRRLTVQPLRVRYQSLDSALLHDPSL